MINNKYIINWELSLICNLDCSFCSQKERRNENKINLKKEEIFKIIENLPYNCHISFLGGETLIFPNIIDIFNKLDEKNISYEITTNGIMLNKFLNNFKYLKKLTNINISIDGYGLFHDNSRGKKGLFKSIVKIIPDLQKIININISTVITYNLEDENLIKLYLVLNKLGIKNHKLIYLMNFSKDDIKKSKEKIDELIISSPGSSNIEKIVNYKNNFIRKYSTLKKLGLKTNIGIEPASIFLNKKTYCKQTDKQYRINEKGNLSICEFIDNEFINLINNNFENAIKNIEYNKLKNKINDSFPLDICKTCCKNYNK